MPMGTKRRKRMENTIETNQWAFPCDREDECVGGLFAAQTHVLLVNSIQRKQISSSETIDGCGTRYKGQKQAMRVARSFGPKSQRGIFIRSFRQSLHGRIFTIPGYKSCLTNLICRLLWTRLSCHFSSGFVYWSLVWFRKSISVGVDYSLPMITIYLCDCFHCTWDRIPWWLDQLFAETSVHICLSKRAQTLCNQLAACVFRFRRRQRVNKIIQTAATNVNYLGTKAIIFMALHSAFTNPSFRWHINRDKRGDEMARRKRYTGSEKRP